MNLVFVHQENIHLLKTFIENIGEASKSFRYFNKRTIDVINNHLVTILLLENEFPVAYGHLDSEKDIVWLGICVLPAFSGKGYGNEMMKALIENAKRLKLNSITLTVDKENKLAINLYEKFNFQRKEEKESFYKYVLLTNKSFISSI